MKPTLTTCVAVALSTLLIVAGTTPAHSQTEIKIDSGPISLDGPVGRDGIFPVSTSLPTIDLGDYTFNDLSPNDQNCLAEGWTTHDLTTQDDMYFHVDDFGGLGGGDFGRLVALAGSQSLWCGARAATIPPLCEYGLLPGYGNGWNQGWCTINCLPVTGSVNVNFDMTWDMEPGYDAVSFEFDQCDDNWQEFAGGITVYDGFGTVLGETHTVSGASHSGNVRIRIRAFSDGAFSDEDVFNTDGACVIDNLSVTDGIGPVLPLEDFEGETVGAQAANDWNACLPLSYGDFACLFPAAQAMQEVATADCRVSCVWGFFCGSLTNYACGPGIPGIQGNCDGFGPAQTTVPYVNVRNQYIHNEIRSPWMAFTGLASYSTDMDFDVYRDLPLDNLVFYTWRVRTRSVVGGCPEIGWQNDNLLYYGGVDWHTQTIALDPFLGPNPAEIQVALGVIDACRFWCGIYGTGACHSHSPMFDNVRVYRHNTMSWVVNDVNLFQDSFKPLGPGLTVPIDTPEEDYAEIRVTEPEFGIGYLIPGDNNSGPAVFCHVRNLPGKSGAIISGGGQYPEVPSMSTADWTVLQMYHPQLFGTRYLIDLNDALYEPGDTVSFYFSARDGGGGVSYFSHEIGRTDTEALAQAHPMEATCLPAGGAASSGILYVDDYSGFGAEPYFMTTFEALALEVDRFDRRAPDAHAANSLGDEVPVTFPTLDPYDCIVWNTGTHGRLTDTDYTLLWEWLNTTTSDVGLYLSGDDIASDMAASASVAASSIISTYIDYTVTSTSHMAAGEPVSPLVIGEIGGVFDDVGGPDTLIVLGSTPAIMDFDVIQPSGSAVLQASYSGNSANGAVVSQSTTNPEGSTVTVVLAGFSFHRIGDNWPPGPNPLVTDRYEHMHDVFVALNKLVQTPTGGDTPHFQTALAQNVPNPFNPVTTISYSLHEESPVQIEIYDVSGARVRTLVDNKSAGAGEYSIDWDGTNDGGTRVASGVYFYRMVASNFTQTRKMVLLK